MSYRMMTAGIVALMAFGASAQTADKRASLEPAHSPFTYEALGATPTVRLSKAASAGEERVAAARDRGNGTATPSRPNDTARVENPLGLPRATRQ